VARLPSGSDAGAFTSVARKNLNMDAWAFT